MPTTDRRLTRGTRALAVTVSAVVLTGCFTGLRPTLLPRPVVDDPAAQVVLDRLDRAPSTTFGATYEITPTREGAEPITATVTQLDGRQRIEIGDVDFVADGETIRTCDGSGCVDFLDDARVSDLQITHRFWGDAFETRLELDASRRVGFSTGSTTSIADQPAACVDIQIPSTVDASSTVQYCALDAGVLGRYVGADLRIELTSFTPTPADLVFAR